MLIKGQELLLTTGGGSAAAGGHLQVDNGIAYFLLRIKDDMGYRTQVSFCYLERVARFDLGIVRHSQNGV